MPILRLADILVVNYFSFTSILTYSLSEALLSCSSFLVLIYILTIQTDHKLL